jgi:DegV family protein with EDD domain
MNVTVGGVNYFDKLSINNKILFEMIPDSDEYPTTATPYVKYIENTYQKLIKNFDDIIVLSVASKQSGTYDVFLETSKKYNKDGKKITVIDTYGNSVAEGILVKKASDMLMQGKTTDEIINYVEDAKKRTKIYLCLNTLKYVVKSGRVSKTTGKIGTFLGMLPIASISNEGKAITFGVAFSKKGLTKKIAKLIKKEMNINGIESYALVHCLNEELANEYKDLFTSIIGKAPEYIMDSACSAAIHTGIGTVGIGYIKNTPKNTN